jgi:hypothetical protein
MPAPTGHGKGQAQRTKGKNAGNEKAGLMAGFVLFHLFPWFPRY